LQQLNAGGRGVGIRYRRRARFESPRARRPVEPLDVERKRLNDEDSPTQREENLKEMVKNRLSILQRNWKKY